MPAASSASNSNDEANADSSPPSSSKVLLGGSDGSTSDSPVHTSHDSAAASQPVWTCKECTYENVKQYATKCAMCGRKRQPNKLKRRSPGAMLELANKRQVHTSIASGRAVEIGVVQSEVGAMQSV